MKELNILNVYQINILQHLLFIFIVKNSIIPRAFNQVFSLIDYIYPTKLSDNSFKICDFSLKLTRFAISFIGPTIGINFLPKVKSLLALLYLKTRLKKNSKFFYESLFF